AYCLKTQPATGETYPKSDLFNKASSRFQNSTTSITWQRYNTHCHIFYHINKQQFLKQNDSARTLFFPLVCRCLSRSGIQLREVQGANTQKGAILLVL
ncbi:MULTISPECIES: hypothetical protein, partial [Klebsiella pneumoniae complex]